MRTRWVLTVFTLSDRSAAMADTERPATMKRRISNSRSDSSAGISGYSEFEEQIKAGKMIPLAVSGKGRIPGVNVPTLTELGVNVTESNWRGVFAAPGISDAQRNGLIDFVTRVRASQAWQQELTTRKWTDAFMTERPFERDLAKDIADKEVLMKELGLA